MTLTTSQNRAEALDALRGLAIIAMILSGQMPFSKNALPSWMYHAQVPPPDFQFNDALPGISWVDLVFPIFLFSMGAAFPLAFNRRMEQGMSRWRLMSFVMGRGFLLAFFAMYVELIRPSVLSHEPTTATWLQSILGFVILFPILTRLPSTWPRVAVLGVRVAGWSGAILFCWLTRYPDGTGFSLDRSDIIIVVLANMAVFGSLVWILTRRNLLLRVGILGIVFAIRMSNLPAPAEGWVHDLWEWSPAPWIYRLYYLQYLSIVIPGTIAGDMILAWLKAPERTGSETVRGPGRHILTVALMAALVLELLVGLKSRWLLSTTLVTLALCIGGLLLLARTRTVTETLYRDLFRWAVYWLVLGLVFEPYEGGIKKDHPTLSYYFVTSGVAICVYIALSIIIDVLRRGRWLRLLIDNGRNPMIAYAAIQNLTLPVLALTGGAVLLHQFATTPWLGFWKGVIITLITAAAVSCLTRLKIYWRT